MDKYMNGDGKATSDAQNDVQKDMPAVGLFPLSKRCAAKK
jgi:hypothetical protein